MSAKDKGGDFVLLGQEYGIFNLICAKTVFELFCCPLFQKIRFSYSSLCFCPDCSDEISILYVFAADNRKTCGSFATALPSDSKMRRNRDDASADFARKEWRSVQKIEVPFTRTFYRFVPFGRSFTTKKADLSAKGKGGFLVVLLGRIKYNHLNIP